MSDDLGSKLRKGASVAGSVSGGLSRAAELADMLTQKGKISTGGSRDAALAALKAGGKAVISASNLNSVLAGMKKSSGPDPVPAFKFTIEIGGSVVGKFTECSGLGLEREVETHKEGGVNDHVHLLPGRTTQARVTLKRGITADMKLWDWYQKGLYTCLVEPKMVSIVLYARDSASEVRRWNLMGAYPVKWSGPSLNTGSTELAFETIELAHQGLSIISGGKLPIFIAF